MLSLYLVLCATVFFGEAAIYYQKDAAKLFDEFIKEYDRHYESEGEYQRRFNVFKQKLLEINDLNEKNGDAVFGINKFADYTEEELQQMVGIGNNFNDTDAFCALQPVEKQKSPDAFDWRDKNVVTPVKNQGNCRSCWAFSTTGNLESKNAIKTGKLVELSEQQLVDCDKYAGGCLGASSLGAGMKYFIEDGALTEQDYPYTAAQGQCKYNQNKVVVKPSSCESFDTAGKEDAVTGLLVKHGPLTVGLASQAVSSYHGGIMKHCPGQVDHAVLLVGYGTENNVPYWIIKNSWGPTFGEKGYFRILRGQNMCQITQAPMVAVDV